MAQRINDRKIGNQTLIGITLIVSENDKARHVPVSDFAIPLANN